ncbi:hypothetical protein KAR91_69330 [Candidatus Pacearchaeota archaeon]|nr:hypothetical protein [Candidatus Pacearchaeota archaeon]
MAGIIDRNKLQKRAWDAMYDIAEAADHIKDEREWLDEGEIVALEEMASQIRIVSDEILQRIEETKNSGE